MRTDKGEKAMIANLVETFLGGVKRCRYSQVELEGIFCAQSPDCLKRLREKICSGDVQSVNLWLCGVLAL